MTFRKIILFLLISLSLVANVQARMPTERPASTSASILSCHLSNVQYAASGSTKECTELRTILMLVMGISSDLESVTLLICQLMKQSNFFVKTSENYVQCFVLMVRTPYSLPLYLITSDHTKLPDIRANTRKVLF